MNPTFFSSFLTFLSKFSLILLDISISTNWIDTKYLTIIYGPQRMNPNDFGDPLTFSSSATMRSIYVVLAKYKKNNNCMLDCHKMLYWHSRFPEDEPWRLLYIPSLFLWCHQQVLTYFVRYLKSTLPVGLAHYFVQHSLSSEDES